MVFTGVKLAGDNLSLKVALVGQIVKGVTFFYLLRKNR